MYYREFLECLPYAASDGKRVMLAPEDIKNILTEMRPIVATQKGENAKVSPVEEGDMVDLPFKTCFFEILNGSFTLMREGNRALHIVGLLVREVEPGFYNHLILMNDGPGTPSVIHAINQPEIKAHCLGMVQGMLQRMSREMVGNTVDRGVVKVKTSSEKIKRRIGQVIYISPKSDSKEIKSIEAKIEWSHRWRVRGHWVNLPKGENAIGKDREGKYCIVGKTWRVDHIKGDENLPLVEKIRVVE